MTFANFRLSGKNPVLEDLFTHLVDTAKVNSHSFNIFVDISLTTAFLVLKSQFLTSATETGRNENTLIPLYFVFTLQMLGCFS